MFGLQTTITITQVSTTQYPNRTKVFVFNFVNSNNGASTWENLTDTYNIVLPRRIYFKDTSNNKTITWDNTPVYGNPDVQPLILRGDKVKVEQGYSYYKPTQNGGFDRANIVVQKVLRFEGFIVKIKNKTPIELECKDNMFCLQQTVVQNKEWNVDGKKYTLETMLKEMMAKSTYPGVKDFTIKTDNYKHTIQKFYTQGYTMGQVLDDLRKNYHLESFFRGNELRCGVIRYYPEDRITHTFHFQRNIVEDNLDYQRADDMRIGILAKSINKIELVSTNAAGKKKTKHVELKVTVGDPDGEIRTLFFWGVQTEAELKKVAEKKLPFLKYEGFRGSFTTFSLPKVKHGDAVQLIDEVLPERKGTYLVKSVEDICTTDGGFRQKITLDIRIDRLNSSQLSDFQQNGL